MKKLDLTGQRFGRLVVIKEAERKGGHRRWLCLCDCGNETICHQTSLRGGTTKSCGCLQREVAGKYEGPRRRTRNDITGQRFGNLVVIREAPNKQKWTARWVCRCDCGNEVDVQYGALASGNTRSCGCIGRKKSSEHMTKLNIERNARGETPPLFRDLTGQEFGKLKVLGKGDLSPSGTLRWRCLCQCGNETQVTTAHLKSGHTLSCGCLSRELLVELSTTHGDSKTKLYNVFKSMHNRCERPNVVGYKNYGGKGVRVCDAWSDWVTFRDWALSNGYQEGLTIDRVDSDGNYCPENCRWITKSENSRRVVRKKK